MRVEIYNKLLMRWYEREKAFVTWLSLNLSFSSAGQQLSCVGHLTLMSLQNPQVFKTTFLRVLARRPLVLFNLEVQTAQVWLFFQYQIIDYPFVSTAPFVNGYELQSFWKRPKWSNNLAIKPTIKGQTRSQKIHNLQAMTEIPWFLLLYIGYTVHTI